jgi:dihydroflavonol-4-reductase
MPRVFLTGGGGYIGGELAGALLARGDEVVGLARTEAAARSLAAREARVVRGDVLDRAALERTIRGCELVYHVAGVNSHCPKDPARLEAVNSRGSENVVLAAAKHDVERVILTSSAATIGEPKGTIGTESSTHRGSYLSAYERSKFDGERAAFRAGTQTGVQVVALNPSSVQGPPRSGGNAAIIFAYLNRRLRVFVDTDVSIVDVRDVVQAHLLAGKHGQPGRRYVLNGATVNSIEALRLLAELSGVRYRVRLIPPALARAAATASEHMLRVGGKTSPICRARIDTILHGHRYDGSLATRELKLRYTPLRDTFQHMIEWAQAAGLISIRTPDGRATADH